MAGLPKEIVEQILVRLDIKDLIRYKSVSKSWRSFISDPNFMKSHLEYGYCRDQENSKFGNRRIVMSPISCCDSHRFYDTDNRDFENRERHLLGSSNGLVCVSTSRTDYLVVNPETREVKKLKKPNIPELGNLIYGFGYDASSDDYKVILGYRSRRDLTRFQMFSLKSNTWEIIENMNYIFASRIGILVGGSLHWLAYRSSPLTTKKVILSYDLSNNKFSEIPQPDDQRYWFDVSNSEHFTIRLGIVDDYLCVFCREMLPYYIWVMKNDGIKQSWELVGPDSSEHKLKTETVHRLKELKNYIPNKNSLCHENWSVESREFVGSPLYIPSLVSPNAYRKPRKKRLASSYKRTGKAPYFGLFPTASSNNEENLEGQQSKHLRI